MHESVYGYVHLSVGVPGAKRGYHYFLELDLETAVRFLTRLLRIVPGNTSN